MILLGVLSLLVGYWTETDWLWSVGAFALLIGSIVSVRGALGRRSLGFRSWW